MCIFNITNITFNVMERRTDPGNTGRYERKKEKASARKAQHFPFI